MRDAVSGLGRIAGEDGHTAFVASGPQASAWTRESAWTQGTSLTIAQAATTGEHPSAEQWERDTAGQGKAASALSALYSAHYASLVRVAVLLTGDLARAQKIVEDAFVAMDAQWRRLNGQGAAVAYLRRCVVKGSRSVFDRSRSKYLAVPSPGPLAGAEPALLAALRALPRLEREVLVLRYYAELTDVQIALATGTSQGAVKSHTARAMQALHGVLGREP